MTRLKISRTGFAGGDARGAAEGRRADGRVPGGVGRCAALVAAATAVLFLGVQPAYALRKDESQAGYSEQGAVQKQQARPVRKQAQVAAVHAAEAAGLEVDWPASGRAPFSVRGPNLGKRGAFSGGKGLALKGGGAFGQDAIAVLDNLSPLFGVKDSEKEFRLKRESADELGFRHVRMHQTHEGLRVVGGELIVHFDGKGVPYEVNGDYVPEIAVGVQPALKAADAVRLAQAHLSAAGLPEGTLEREPELVVYARETEPVLAYELTLGYKGGRAGIGRWRFWINALDGRIVLRYNNVPGIAPPSANGAPATVSGTRLPREDGEVVSVQAWRENTGMYYLYNNTFKWRLLNDAESGYPDANTFAYRATSDWGESDPAEVSAGLNVHIVQQYYKEVHKRNSYDNKGALANAYVHVLDYDGTPMANAYWDGTAMKIGDGDGETADNLAVLDIFSHEYTHAVTEYAADLVYQNESGALNESFSDIFGACAEFYGQADDRASYPAATPGMADWLMGEDSWLGSTALRDLRNPANPETVGPGNEQPTRYKGEYWYFGVFDNGGVHQNSGPHNFMFYLLSDGGEGINDGLEYKVTGIGIENAEKIAYRVLEHYCTANTDYPAVRKAWISAARDLDTNWVSQVKRAWAAIMPVEPLSIYSPSNLPPGRVGTPYSFTLGVAGGESPFTWEMVSGTLPPNLTLENGALIGMPEVAGTTTFSARVVDDFGAAVTNDFSLTINPVLTAPLVETFENGGVMPDGWFEEFVQGQMRWSYRNGSPQGHPVSAYSNQFNAFLGVETHTQVVTRLVTPRIDFGPDVQAAQVTFWLYMESWLGSQDELRLYYRTTAMEEWTLLRTFSTSVGRWTQQTVTLPSPSRTYYLAFEGTARYGYGINIDQIQIYDPTPPLGITTPEALPGAVTEVPYSLPLSAEGGHPPYSFAVQSGALPEGFTLSSGGVLSGLSSNVQSAAFTVRLTDALGDFADKSFTLEVALPRAPLFAEDFENRGYLPNGWTQEFVTNEVSWTSRAGAPYGHPSAPHSGSYNACFFSSAWANGGSFDQKTKLVTKVIDLGQAPALIKLTFWHHMEEWDGGQDELRVYYRTVTNTPWILLPDATYVTTVASWTQRSVMLPNPSRTYQLAFEGNAHFGYGVCLDDILISDATDAPLFNVSAALPGGVIGLEYSTVLEATGGVEPYTWTLMSGALPAGLTLDGASGTISGVPGSATLASFQVKVAGSDGKASTNAFTLRITAARTMPFTETFEHDGAMPAGWTQEYMGLPVDWVFRPGSPVSPNGIPSAAHSNSQYNACLFYNNSNGRIARLISPMLNVGSGTNAQARLTFWHCMAKYINDQDQLKVLYRTSVTSSWVVLADYRLNTAAWTERTLDLPEASPTYYIAFEGWAKYGYGVCIDNIGITGTSAMSAYDQWKLDAFGDEAGNDLIAGDEADPDGDGIQNALEWAMGLDPNSFDTEGLPFGGISAGYLTLSFRMDKEALDAGALFEVEACTDLILADWTTLEVSEQLPRADSNTWWQAVFQHDVPVTNAPQRFLRLKVTPP